MASWCNLSANDWRGLDWRHLSLCAAFYYAVFATAISDPVLALYAFRGILGSDIAVPVDAVDIAAPIIAVSVEGIDAVGIETNV